MAPVNRQTLSAEGLLQIDYQRGVDLLFAWIGQPEPARNIEVEPGVYVRVAPAGNRILGLEILDCASRFHMEPDAVNEAFAQSKLQEFGALALAKAQA